MRKWLVQLLVLVVIGGLFLGAAVQPALAQGTTETNASSPAGGGDDDGALGDVIIDALKGFLSWLLTPIKTAVAKTASGIVDLIVSTPHPNSIFSTPTNGPWSGFYDTYWNTIVPLALSLYGLAIGVVIFLESTSHLFSGYHRSKLKKRAFAGLLGILSWWWLAGLSLQFTDALAGFLAPDLSEITLFQLGSFTAMSIPVLAFASGVDLVLLALLALVYLARVYVLYLFVLLMPILIVLWIPGLGPFALVSKFMKKLAGFYVPFLFMTIPVALLFRVGHILGTNVGVSGGDFAQWLSALVIPVLALFVPLVMFWQAGLLFFLADRASRHVSARRARNRLSKGQTQLQTGRQGGQNFVRGVRGEPAVTSSGQYVFDSGDSRAHAAGQRLHGAGTRLRDVFRDGTGDATTPTADTSPALPEASPSALPETDPPALPAGESSSDGGGGGSGGGGNSGGGAPTGYDRSTHDNLRDPSRRSSTASTHNEASHTDAPRSDDTNSTGDSTRTSDSTNTGDSTTPGGSSS